MVKIWRNRIWAGTQRLSDCPSRYRSGVIAMMRDDLADGRFIGLLGEDTSISKRAK